MKQYLLASLILLFLAFVQNVSFSIVSRSRNRSSYKFHLFASIFSNSIWFLTFRQLVTANMNFALFPWYCIGTVAGSLFGVSVSMKIEKWLHAESDSHLKPKISTEELEKRIIALECGNTKKTDGVRNGM